MNVVTEIYMDILRTWLNFQIESGKNTMATSNKVMKKSNKNAKNDQRHHLYK